MNKKERLEKVRAMTAGISPDKWSEEAKNLYLEVISDDYNLVSRLFRRLIAENPGEKEYIIRVDEDSMSMLIVALNFYIEDTAPRLLKPVGYNIIDGIVVNTAEFSKQLGEIAI